MARIKLELPQEFSFETTLPVRISDINYGGHLGNDRVLSLIHEARFQYYKSLGYRDELSIDGVGTIQADTAIVYKGEAFHGDEIKVQIAIADITRKSFDVLYALSCEGKEIARAKTGIVMFNYEEGKVCNIPEPFLNKIQN
ncbi:acyl-CoA thioesterase [Roseivirga sp.]|uniref:acyl-CoA thioesterase n=1 Tax=Roseivirga sp. TaxID=1964215 RepID=UPI003B52994C